MLCLTRVRLIAFGRFREADFVLRPGFNLILGANEAGKSTFAAAIAGVIFGFRRERERYLPWEGGDRYEAEVTFAYADRHMSIARDFHTDRVRAVERRGDTVTWRFEGKASPAGRSSEREEYLAKIESIWGFSEGDIFGNSVFVGQRDLPVVGTANLGSRLQQLLSGFAEMDYDGVVADLERELYSLTRKQGGRSRDRELEEVRGRLAELGRQWQSARESLAEIQKREAAVAELAGWVAVARADLEKGRHYLGRVRHYHELAMRRTQLESDFSRIDGERLKVEKLLGKQEELEEKLAGHGDVISLSDEFPVAAHACREAAAKLAGLEAEVREAEAEAGPRGNFGGGRVLVAFVVIWFVAGVGIYGYPALLAPLLLGALALSVVAVVRSVRQRQEWRIVASRRAGRVEALRAEIASLAGIMADWESRFPGINEFTAVDGGARKADFHAMKRLQGELAQVGSALGVLPDHDSLVARGRDLTRELAVIGERLEAVTATGFHCLSAEEFVAAEEKVQRLEAELGDKERLCREQEQDLAVLRRTALDLGYIEDEGSELREKEARLVRRVAALQLAIELLRETLDEYRTTYLSRFAREVGGRFCTLTAGRYGEVAVDADFNLQVVAGGKLRPVSTLSCGAEDQAYLAIRIGLGSILSRGKNLPFFLDDPLVNFDSGRRAAALHSLNLLARDHQVLLFVHDDRYGRVKGTDDWHKITLQQGRDDGQLHLL